MLEEWFEDRTLYHMVGFLVSQGMHINEIRKLSLDCTKSIFEQRLRSEIYRRVIGKQLPTAPDEQAIGEDVGDRLADLTYGSKHRIIRSVPAPVQPGDAAPKPAVESAFSIRQFQERTLGHRAYPFSSRRQTRAPPRSSQVAGQLSRLFATTR